MIERFFGFYFLLSRLEILFIVCYFILGLNYYIFIEDLIVNIGNIFFCLVLKINYENS